LPTGSVFFPRLAGREPKIRKPINGKFALPKIFF
jgi:hypothetical protein